MVPAQSLVMPPVRQRMRRLEQTFLRYFPLILLASLIYLTIEEWLKYPLLHFVDWLYISTIIVFLFGVRIGMQFPAKAERLIRRLVNRGSLLVSAQDLPALLRSFEARSARWAVVGGVIGAVAIVLLYAFTIAIGGISQYIGPLRTSLTLTAILIETFIGYATGYYFGYAVSNGTLGTFLARRGAVIRPQPGHLDGVAGLRPVGSFYFAQAGALALAALFLGVWWFLIGTVPALEKGNESWRTPYLILFFLIIAGEVLAFLAPLWFFHRELRKQRGQLMEEADRISARIAELQARLVDTSSVEEAHEFKDQQAVLTDYYWAIQRMPTWPIALSTWWRFAVSNLGLLIPLVAQFFAGNITAWASQFLH